jgi:23S rRNA pseudouridine1911/1915/1917 synthase
MKEIPILYEDENLVVVDKPVGLMVHADGRSDEFTVADWVISRYPQTKEVGEPITLSNGKIVSRPGIIHRIDKETSGVLIIVKDIPTFFHIKKQFKAKKIAKEYRLFVYGVIKQERGIIDRPIGRSRSDFRKRSAQRGARGDVREAQTTYRVVSRGAHTTFVEARPHTGRTHQIRVHFKAINHPIVADPLYGEGKPSLLGFQRLALHARSIEFVDKKGMTVRVEAPYPPDFEHAIKEIGAR